MFDSKKKKAIYKNPYLIFLPFLLSALLLVLKSRTICTFEGDEAKYINYSKSLIQGYFSQSAQSACLDVGPGYSLVLAPFIALKSSQCSLALLNAFFFYFSIVLLYKSLLKIVSLKLTLIGSLFWALFYNAYENFQYVIPETISPFLGIVLLYFLLHAFDESHGKNKKYIYFAGFAFGFLALTKIIFGYVIIFLLMGLAILWLFKRQSANYRKGFLILLLALATATPYLMYTYHLTGKVFYWGSTSGNNLYWMSTPYKEEYGSWFPTPINKPDLKDSLQLGSQFRQRELTELRRSDKNLPGTNDYIKLNHLENFDKLKNLTVFEKDEALRKIAIENIKSHPIKFIENCFSNLGRIVLNYPYSYKIQKPGTLLRFPQSGILMVLMLFCLYPTLLNWRKIIFPIKLSIFILALYMGGSVVGSAETRMFTVIVPILIFILAFVLERTIIINWKFQVKS